jgi:5'-phosphate synthase pdxT subunit
MTIYELREPVQAMAARGEAIWGTCAGMVMMASEIAEQDPIPLNIMDIGVLRNAFGRQVDSFEQDISVAGLDSNPYHAIFIRAPVITRVGEQVQILATLPDGRPVAVRQGNLLATSFHPELTHDNRLHRHFLELASWTPSGLQA